MGHGRWGWLALVLLGAAPRVLGQAGDDAKVDYFPDLVYGKGAGQELHLDLAVPKGNGPFPCILFLHGGGWAAGSYKSFGADGLKNAAAQGFVAASVQYRLTRKAADPPTAEDAKFQFPAQVEDVKCAVRWLRGHAAKYKIDPDHVGALGNSAGAHLALLLGLTTAADRLEGAGDLDPAFAKHSSQVQAVVSFFGPTDLTVKFWDDPQIEKLVEAFLGGKVADRREAAVKASPLSYVKKGRALPPVLCFHGDKDGIVHLDQSKNLVEALKAAGGTAELVTVEGQGHGWRGEKMQETLSRTVAFFRQHLGGKP